jgi:hypothetical protein
MPSLSQEAFGLLETYGLRACLSTLWISLEPKTRPSSPFSCSIGGEHQLGCPGWVASH